jgi:hypothetical protein
MSQASSVRQFWGIADLELGEVDLWYTSREAAEVGHHVAEQPRGRGEAR